MNPNEVSRSVAGGGMLEPKPQRNSILHVLIKGIVGTLIITGLTYLSSGSTFGSQKNLYTAITFAIFTVGYFLGVLVGDMKKKN